MNNTCPCSQATPFSFQLQSLLQDFAIALVMAAILFFARKFGMKFKTLEQNHGKKLDEIQTKIERVTPQ